MLGDLGVGLPHLVGANILAIRDLILQARQVHLGQHRHLRGNAALVSQLHAGVGEAFLRRRGKQVEQVEGELQAGVVPRIVDEVTVGVVLDVVIECEVREQAQHGALGFLDGDAAGVGLLAYVGILHQRQLFHALHRHIEQRGVNLVARFLHLEILVERRIDQVRELDAARREFLFDAFEQAQVFQQLALVAQRIDRRANAFGLGLACVLQRIFCKRNRLAHIVAQLLRAGSAPEGGSYILDQRMHCLAAAFGGDQYAVTLLLGREVAEAEVEQVPRQAEVVHLVRALGGNVGIGKRRRTGHRVDAACDEILVTRDVAGRCHEARQHVPTGGIELVERQCFFHYLDAAVEVVFQRAGNCLIHRQCARDRRNALAGRNTISGGLCRKFTLGERLEGNGAAPRQCQSCCNNRCRCKRGRFQRGPFDRTDGMKGACFFCRRKFHGLGNEGLIGMGAARSGRAPRKGLSALTPAQVSRHLLFFTRTCPESTFFVSIMEGSLRM